MCQNNKRRKRQKFDLKLFKSSDQQDKKEIRLMYSLLFNVK